LSSLAAHPRSRQLTAIFLTALQAEGYPLGVGHHQAVQELLERLPVSTEEKVLGDCLVALVATTAAEQQHYRELFHAAQRQVKEMEGDRKQEPEDEFDEGHTKDRWRLAWRLLGLLLLVLLPFLAYLLWPPQEVVVPGRTLAVLEQQRTLLPDLDSLPKLGEVRRIELPPAGSSELPQRGKLDTLGERVYFTAYSYDSLAPQDTFTLTLRGRLKRFAQLQYAVVIRPDTTRSPGPDEVVLTPTTPATPELDYSPIEPLPYPRGLADLVVAEAKGFGFADFLYYAWWPFLLLMYGALILGYYLYLGYRRRRDVRLIAQRDQFDGAPHFWRIELPELRKSIDWGQHYPRLLRQMRRRREDEHQEIDLGRSIEQTIHQGGLPSFAYRSSSRPAEYLLLIDRGVHNNHYTRLFDELYRQLHAEEVLIERFFYDGDPRLLYREDRAMTVTLTSLQRRFPNSQLLMVGTGDRLLSPATGKLTKWAAEQLGAWTDRSLLTTLPPSQWGVEEQRLANFFALLPATMQGLRLLVERTEEDEGTRRGGAYRSLISDAEEASINFSGSLVGSLLDHFALPQVQWIAACAIYPSLHWDLTLFFGKQVGEATGNLLLTSRQLLSLARIPWFANGSIPPAARAELTRWLQKTAPALDRALRLALHETLEEHVPAPAGSVARRELDFFRLQNEWLLAADDPARRAQLSRQLAQEIAAGNAPDVTIVRFLEEAVPPEGTLPLPKSWAKNFYREGIPGLGYGAKFWSLIPVLAMIQLVAFFGSVNQPPPPAAGGDCAAPIVAVTDSITFGQDTVLNLQLCDKLDSLILAEYRWRERIGRAVQLSDLDTLTILDTRPVPEAVDGNMAFNQPTSTLTYLLNFIPRDSLDQTHLANIGAMLWNRGTELDAEEDCRFFRAAGRLTTLGPARTLVVRVCVARLETPQPPPPEEEVSSQDSVENENLEPTPTATTEQGEEEGSQDDLPVVIPPEEAIIVPEAEESDIVDFGQPTVPKPTMIRLPGGTFRMGDTFGDRWWGLRRELRPRRDPLPLLAGAGMR
jgi:hypothetical protein